MQKEQDDHRKMINSLIKGDWVITIGGVVAQIKRFRACSDFKSGHTNKSGKSSSGTGFALVKHPFVRNGIGLKKRAKKAVRRKIPSRKKQ